MSRHYDAAADRDIVIDADMCRHLYDGLWCMSEKCPLCYDSVKQEEYCREGISHCKFFEPERRKRGTGNASYRSNARM